MPRTIGPLTRVQRGRYMLAQMRKGITQWFKCLGPNLRQMLKDNWGKVLIGALVAAIAIIVTGGSIIPLAFSLLPPLLAAYFLADTIARHAGNLRDFIGLGWGGETAKSAQSLAKVTAAAAVAIISAALTYLTAGAFKAVAAGARAVGKAAGSVARGAGRLARGVVAAAKAGGRRLGAIGKRMLGAGKGLGKAAIRRGRLVIRGLERGFSKGVKTMKGLAARLGKKLGFRRFVLERHNVWIILYGIVNPKVQLARAKAPVKATGIKTVKSDRKRLPRKITDVVQHKAGNSQIVVDGTRWHVPAGKGLRNVPKSDTIGDKLQTMTKEAGARWSRRNLSAREARAIAGQHAKGKHWLGNLLAKQAKGRWVEQEVKAAARAKRLPLNWSSKGLDAVNPATGIRYDIMSGTPYNRTLHAKREAKALFRMIEF